MTNILELAQAMTDIVERLEGPLSGINRQWVLEAATEIKRLRAEVAVLADMAGDINTRRLLSAQSYAALVRYRALEPKP